MVEEVETMCCWDVRLCANMDSGGEGGDDVLLGCEGMNKYVQWC